MPLDTLQLACRIVPHIDLHIFSAESIGMLDMGSSVCHLRRSSTRVTHKEYQSLYTFTQDLQTSTTAPLLLEPGTKVPACFCVFAQHIDMIYESHNHTAFRRRAVNRVEQPSTSTPSSLHHHHLPTRMMPSPDHSPATAHVSLPSFRILAEVADQSNLQYMRAPSLGCEYVPVPIIMNESSYASPPESVTAPSPTPTPSRSASPAMPQMALPIRRAKKSSPSYRVEKKTKSAKRKDYSEMARAQELENNRRIDEAQRPYKEGVQAPVNSYLMSGGNSNGHRPFPRFDRAHVPREAKRAKSVTGSSDPNTRHNVAQTHLRAEKGGSRMVLQRLLVSSLGWRGHRLQTVVNAKSSGMLYEEKDLLQASTQLNSLAIVLMQGLFGIGMQQLGGVLDLFEPEDVQPADVVRDPRDDDRTYNLKCQAARIQVIEEAHLPLGLKNVRSQDELLHIIEQKLMPIATDYGKVALQQMFFCKPKEGRSMF
ncbi:hypothetical protein KCU81_g5048, partial [Aureobasidium melanogenum]|uniref:Uncharacterized protein n=1 Tax=Aureobasidium melanogenum (strain CBS 110374) TaxID=1043003 RepID=A0A074VF22_AURM1